MRMHVLALEGVFDLGLSAVVDAFQTANELIEASKIAIEPFDVKIVAVRRRVRTSQGLLVPTYPIDRRMPDCVVVPAIGYKMPAPLEAALARSDVQDATQVLRDYARRDVTMSAACIGTFVMAESGLLNGHTATTTWWLAPLFRRRYPEVALEDSSMIVSSGPFVTAGAALGHMDLALWLIRQVSPQLASLTAQYLTGQKKVGASRADAEGHWALGSGQNSSTSTSRSFLPAPSAQRGAPNAQRPTPSAERRQLRA